MDGTEQSLRATLRLLRETSRAQAVTLYIPVPSSSRGRPQLVHEGRPPFVPELSGLSSAARYDQRADDETTAFPAGPNLLELRIAPSAKRDGWLVRIPRLESLLDTERLDRGPSAEPHAAGAWLGLRFDGAVPDDAAARAGGRGPFGIPGDLWSLVTALSSYLGWQTRREAAALDDPVSGLPVRAEFHRILERSLRAGSGANRPGLIFVNPDEFGIVNERFGREAGDAAIREIGRRMTGQVRRSELAFRFGAAVFGVFLPTATTEVIRRVAERVHEALRGEAYQEGSLRLDFRLGAAVDDPEGDASIQDRAGELIRRADRALHAAKISPDPGLVVWTPEVESAVVSQYDRLTGIYTSNPAKDYRNMLLLWDTVGIVGAHDDVESLVVRVLERLAETFRGATLGIFRRGDDDRPGPGRLLRSEGGGEVETVDAPEFDPARNALFAQASSERRAVTQPLPAEGDAKAEDSPLRACAIPLGTKESPLGYLYLEWRVDRGQLGPADLTFLNALAGQLTMALDRARLIDSERRRREAETKRLEAELEQLREALQHSQLVCRSASMEAVLATARRVAPTDVTVLINGESGSGKELLARMVHQLSERRDRPLVVVDCAAIATSLIDSELFGHERGAYTGAEQRTTGRLAEADRGTILLDEIGELPLEVQSKILRFVQEKQYTRVGSTQPQNVDARVIAVTNRDLAVEVAAGRFREDLFHRLNVVRLVVPPLRERPEDILPLALHFLERFAVQHRKRVRRLSPAAEDLVRAYSWPGNVRELENRMMRAVVLCEGDRIDVGEFELPEIAIGTPGHEDATSGERTDPASTVTTAEDSYRSALLEIREALARQIDAVLGNSDFPPPIGKWAGEDLVLAAYRATDRTASRAASLLAVPETTFRRKLQKARAVSGSGLVSRPEGWEPMRREIVRLVDSGNPEGEDLLERLRHTILEELATRLPGDFKRAAALLGVTEPTYRRWLAELVPDSP